MTKKQFISFLRNLGLKTEVKLYSSEPASEIRDFLEGFEDIEELTDWFLCDCISEELLDERIESEEAIKRDIEREAWYY